MGLAGLIAGPTSSTATGHDDNLLAVLAHELRSPLAGIVSALQVMALRDGGGNAERLVIQRQVTLLTRLVDDLTDASRIARRAGPDMRTVSVRIDDVIEQAVETAAPLCRARQHELLVGSAPGVWVRADPSRLAQVFVNLLSNAARYTDAGGHITLVPEATAQRCRVRVTDDGRGIPADALSRIFELYYRGDPASTPDGAGLGVGLALVKHIVQRHGGTIAVHSTVGQGSEFCVELRRVAG